MLSSISDIYLGAEITSIPQIVSTIPPLKYCQNN